MNVNVSSATAMPKALDYALNALEEERGTLHDAQGQQVAPQDFFQQVSAYEASHGGQVDGAAPHMIFGGKGSGYAIGSVQRLKEMAYTATGLNVDFDRELQGQPEVRRRQVALLRGLVDAGVKFYPSKEAAVPFNRKIATIVPLWRLEDEKPVYASLDGGNTKIKVGSFAMFNQTVKAGGDPQASSALMPFETALQGLEEGGKVSFRGADGATLSAADFHKAVQAYEQAVQSGASGASANAPTVATGEHAASAKGWPVPTVARLKELVFAQAGLKRELAAQIESEPDDNKRRVRTRQFNTMNDLGGRGVKFYRSDKPGTPPIGVKIAPLWRAEDNQPLFASTDKGATRTRVTSFTRYAHGLDGGAPSSAEPAAATAAAVPEPPAAPPAPEPAPPPAPAPPPQPPAKKGWLG